MHDAITSTTPWTRQPIPHDRPVVAARHHAAVVCIDAGGRGRAPTVGGASRMPGDRDRVSNGGAAIAGDGR